MADADFVLGECLGHGGGKLGQLDALEAIGRGFAGLGGDLLDGVFRLVKIEQGAEPLCLLQRVPELRAPDMTLRARTYRFRAFSQFTEARKVLLP